MSNAVLVKHRMALGWGRDRLAAHFEELGSQLGLAVPSRQSMSKAIYRHEVGGVAVTDEMYLRLYCAAFKASPHELFGETHRARSTAGLETFEVTSHKFMPVFVGPKNVDELRELLEPAPAELDVEDAWRAPVEHPHGACTAYGLPWGVLVYHLEENVEPASLAELAVWRRQTYKRELAWTAGHVTDLLPGTAAVPEYVLSAFWLNRAMWEGPALETALRIMAMPRALLDDGGGAAQLEHAQLVEQTLLRDGFHSDQRIVDFGIEGTSLAYASWSGISFFPLSQDRALRPDRLVSFEVVAQSLWAWCHHLRCQVEAGLDPCPPDGFDWRWLRGVRSKVTTPRPQETTQQAAMRDAVMRTSSLDDHLAAALDMLRDAARE